MKSMGSHARKRKTTAARRAPSQIQVIARAAAPAPSKLAFDIGTPLEEIELRVIRETLRHAKGDKSVAAQLLGISTRTIYRKLDGVTE